MPDPVLTEEPAPAVLPGEEFEWLVRQRLDNTVDVREPLALISQVQRSGGTLLSQLLDGHPRLHAHPHELQIGYPRDKRDWPALDLGAKPSEWFRQLRESHVRRSFYRGYRKYARRRRTYEGERLETFPFLLVPSLQRQIFERCVSTWPARTQRDVLDAHMTAYFNAWLDNRNLYARPKRWVTAFSAELAIPRRNRERFFVDYPDGRLLSIIREPGSWYGSAHAYNPQTYGEVESAMGNWLESASAMIDAKRDHGDRVMVIAMHRLLEDVEATMTAVAAFLEIDFLPTLLTPTFNGLPIRANSSFRTERHGVLDAPLARRGTVSPEVLETIDRLAGGIYEQVLALAA